MTVRIITGDALEMLRTLPSESVHMCCTSPPYFGLRDYGTAQWDGGDTECRHIMPSRSDAIAAVAKSTLVGSKDSQGHLQEASYRAVCGLCGARRIDRQIGLEPSPDEYVAALVAVFREVRRVLRKDGTCWINLGDSYASGGRKSRDPGQSKIHPAFEGDAYSDGLRPVDAPGIKPKDLLGIPWLVAFALRADGWWLRQEIIWHKPAPMPESVLDRCTRAHESIFLFAKSELYHFDAAAIAEPLTRPEEADRVTPAKFGGAAKYVEASKQSRLHSGNEYRGTDTGTRNKRSVWTVAPSPFAEAHFATFPPALIEPCILAGCPKGGVVLDCFGGAGTTGLVADRLGRDAVLIELNPDYAAMAERRLHNDAPLFADIAMQPSAKDCAA